MKTVLSKCFLTSQDVTLLLPIVPVLTGNVFSLTSSVSETQHIEDNLTDYTEACVTLLEFTHLKFSLLLS